MTGPAKPDECVLNNPDVFVVYGLYRDSLVNQMRNKSVQIVKRAMAEMRNTPDCIVQIMVSKGLKL